MWSRCGWLPARCSSRAVGVCSASPGPASLPVTAEPFATLRRLVRRADGSLLLLTAGRGVWSWDPRDGVRRLTAPTPGPGENVFAAWEEAPGTVWIGSRDGLLILSDGQLVPPPAALRGQRPVYAITADRAGNVWLGSDGDLTRWDGRVARVYTPADGLAGLGEQPRRPDGRQRRQPLVGQRGGCLTLPAGRRRVGLPPAAGRGRDHRGRRPDLAGGRAAHPGAWRPAS